MGHKRDVMGFCPCAASQLKHERQWWITWSGVVSGGWPGEYLGGHKSELWRRLICAARGGS